MKAKALTFDEQLLLVECAANGGGADLEPELKEALRAVISAVRARPDSEAAGKVERCMESMTRMELALVEDKTPGSEGFRAATLMLLARLAQILKPDDSRARRAADAMAEILGATPAGRLTMVRLVREFGGSGQ